MDLLLHQLDPRMKRVWYTGSLMAVAVTGVAGGIVLAALRIAGVPLVIPAAVLATALLAELADLIISPRVQYATWRYGVTETDVNLRYGLIVKKCVVVPLVRVQHVETRQGPIMKANGLASVLIATAGESFDIPGLDESDALVLRDRVAELARIAKEDV